MTKEEEKEEEEEDRVAFHGIGREMGRNESSSPTAADRPSSRIVPMVNDAGSSGAKEGVGGGGGNVVAAKAVAKAHDVAISDLDPEPDPIEGTPIRESATSGAASGSESEAVQAIPAQNAGDGTAGGGWREREKQFLAVREGRA